jgi:hypothetical protein
MEGGLFAFVILLVLSPFLMWYERSQKFHLLSPVEQNLRRASHGFTLATFVLVAVFGVYGWRVLGFFPLLVTNPAAALLAVVVFGGLFAYGLARFLAGVRRSAGVRDGLLASRAFIKFFIGLAAAVFLYRSMNAGAWGNGENMWAAMPPFLLMGVALWCILTGAVRFVLTIGIRGRPKAPPLHPSPRGAARDASQAEAAAAMQRSGARKIPLDDRRF